MKILISNDDGYFADGIKILRKVLKNHEVTLVAPDRNCSGFSSKITLDTPLYKRKIDKNFYAISGSPADCVHLAINGMLEQKFDLVISGVNDCVNLGDSVLYSGTIAAAIEGRKLEYMPLAISAFNLIEYREMVVKTLQELIDNQSVFIPQVEPHCVLNINLPACHLDELQGCKITKLGISKQPEPVVSQVTHFSKSCYWLGKIYYGSDKHQQDNDYDAIDNNFISITPINLDMTYDKMKSQLENTEFLAKSFSK